MTATNILQEPAGPAPKAEVLSVDPFLVRLDRALQCKSALEHFKEKSKTATNEFLAAKNVSIAKLDYRKAREALKNDLVPKPQRRYVYRGHVFSVDRNGEVHICAK